jgi:hypothetical protein
MEQILRFTSKATATFTNTLATTGGFAFSNYAGALLCCTGTGTLTFFVKPDETLAAQNSTTTRAIVDAGGSAITVVVNNNAVPLPDECYPCNYVLATTSGSNVTCTILLKG